MTTKNWLNFGTHPLLDREDMKTSTLQQENGSDSTSTPPLFTVDQKHSSTDIKEVKNSVHFSIAKYGIFPQFGLVGGMWSLLYYCSVAWTVC